MKTFRVVTQSGTMNIRADYVKFEGQFISLWKKAKDHSGGRDDLLVAYNAERVVEVSQRDEED